MHFVVIVHQGNEKKYANTLMSPDHCEVRTVEKFTGKWEERKIGEIKDRKEIMKEEPDKNKENRKKVREIQDLKYTILLEYTEFLKCILCIFFQGHLILNCIKISPAVLELKLAVGQADTISPM
jgi:hypothetical protein